MQHNQLIEDGLKILLYDLYSLLWYFLFESVSAPELTKTYLYYRCFLIFLSSHEVARDLSSADPGDTGSHVTVHVSPDMCTVHSTRVLYSTLCTWKQHRNRNKTHPPHLSVSLVNILLASTLRYKERVQKSIERLTHIGAIEQFFFSKQNFYHV